jgi:Pectate lyase superfamily protein
MFIREVIMKILAFILWCVLAVTAEASAPADSKWIDGHNWMKCNGVTDDTVGFQTAVNAAAYGTLFLPSGMCIISRTVAVTNKTHIIGAGGGMSDLTAGTTLEWRGPPKVPLLDLQGIQDSALKTF